METCTLNQKELWAIKTWRAAEWESTQGADRQYLTRKELKKKTQALINAKKTEDSKQYIMLDKEISGRHRTQCENHW